MWDFSCISVCIQIKIQSFVIRNHKHLKKYPHFSLIQADFTSLLTSTPLSPCKSWVVPWRAELTWQVSSRCSRLSRCMVDEPAAALRLLWASCSHSSSWPTLSRHTWRTASPGRGPGWDRGSSRAWDKTQHTRLNLQGRRSRGQSGGGLKWHFKCWLYLNRLEL